jgi:hypothetical protein
MWQLVNEKLTINSWLANLENSGPILIKWNLCLVIDLVSSCFFDLVLLVCAVEVPSACIPLIRISIESMYYYSLEKTELILILERIRV